MKFEKHTFLVNRCIGANNLMVYWLISVFEVINLTIVFIGMMAQFEKYIDESFITFLIYFPIIVAHLGVFLKKVIVHGKSIITNETLNERLEYKNILYKHKRLLSMQEKMQGM